MATADMNRLIDLAKIRLPGALDTALQMELFAVMDEFFIASNLWTDDISFVVVPTSATHLEDPDAFTYPVAPAQGTIHRLLGVVNSQNVLQAATMAIPGEIVIKNSPNETDTYTARLALTVTDPVTSEGYPQFPDWVMNRYGTDILDGLLGRMMSQIAKPYSAPNMALTHLKKFRSSTMSAKVDAQHKNIFGGQSWRFPQSFASRSNKRF